MKNFTFIFLFVNIFLFSQENGNWELNSISTNEININAGEVKEITIDLPLGTSKFFYKIEVLKKFGEAGIKLSDLISQGGAFNPKLIALGEATKVSINMSDAKIKYSITSLSDNNSNLCYLSNDIVTGVKKEYFDYTNKNCVDISGSKLSLNFKFASHNKYFPLKVSLELIPFVDNDLKSGWSQNIKNSMYNQLVNSIKQMKNNLPNETIEKFASCIMTNLTRDYTFQQFKLLAEYEKENYFEKLKTICDK